MEECFALFNSLGKWVCIYEKETELLECHPEFQQLIEEQQENMEVERWLTYFHVQDRSVLRLILKDHNIRETNGLQVRILSGDIVVWIHLSIIELSSNKTAIIGNTMDNYKTQKPSLDITQPYPSNNVDHFMTWLSLINKEMITGDVPLLEEHSSTNIQESSTNNAYRRLKEVVEKIPHGFAVINQEWEILYINPTLEKIFHTSLQDVYKTSLWDLFPIDVYHNYFVQYTKAMEKKQVVHFQDYLYELGKIVEVTAYPDATELTLFVQDITEAKSYVDALQETEERFSLLAENVNEAFWIGTSTFHEWEYISPSFEKIFGLPITKLMQNSAIWLNYVHADDRKKVIESFKQMRKEKIAVEFRFQHPSGDWKWIRSKGYPLKKVDRTTVVGVLEDITDAKEMDELQARSDQYETVVRVAAGIAHEIRNPLTSIKGFLQLMLSNQSSDNQYSDIIFSELARIETIVNEFMLLAKPNSEEALMETDVVDIIHYAASLFGNQMKQQNVQLEMVMDSTIPLIKSDPKRLKQVFINLVKNSLEAMDNAGELLISGRYLRGQRELEFKVEDSGKGIEKEQLKRLGEPFYTTKEKGTGLGIMVTTKFVESLGGRIQYESEVGVGTTVTVTLPTNPK